MLVLWFNLFFFIMRSQIDKHAEISVMIGTANNYAKEMLTKPDVWVRNAFWLIFYNLLFFTLC